MWGDRLSDQQEQLKDMGIVYSLWDKSTPHAYKFAIKGNTITMIKGDDRDWYQLVGSDHLPKGSTTIKATIKQYRGGYSIAFGLLTESRRNERCSGG